MYCRISTRTPSPHQPPHFQRNSADHTLLARRHSLPTCDFEEETSAQHPHKPSSHRDDSVFYVIPTWPCTDDPNQSQLPKHVTHPSTRKYKNVPPHTPALFFLWARPCQKLHSLSNRPRHLCSSTNASQYVETARLGAAVWLPAPRGAPHPSGRRGRRIRGRG